MDLEEGIRGITMRGFTPMRIKDFQQIFEREVAKEDYTRVKYFKFDARVGCKVYSETTQIEVSRMARKLGCYIMDVYILNKYDQKTQKFIPLKPTSLCVEFFPADNQLQYFCKNCLYPKHDHRSCANFESFAIPRTTDITSERIVA